MSGQSNLSADRLDAKPREPRRALWLRILLPRFSLRTMLVLITIFCIALVVIPRWIKAKNQRDIVDALIRIDQAEIDRRNKEADEFEEPRDNSPVHHISVIYDDYLDACDPEGLVSVAGKFEQFLESIFGRDYCHDVIAVESRASYGDDILWTPEYSKAIAKIGKLQSIRELNLSISNQSYSEAIPSIRELKNLRELNLIINTFHFNEEHAKDLSLLPSLKNSH